MVPPCLVPIDFGVWFCKKYFGFDLPVEAVKKLALLHFRCVADPLSSVAQSTQHIYYDSYLHPVPIISKIHG